MDQGNTHSVGQSIPHPVGREGFHCITTYRYPSPIDQGIAREDIILKIFEKAFKNKQKPINKLVSSNKNNLRHNWKQT